MINKPLVAATLVAALSLSAGSAALAQAAAPAAPAVTHGPAIPGVCIFSMEGAIASSTVGKYVNTRMEQIITQVNSELNAEKTAIDNEAKALDGQRATIDQNAYEQRAAALQVRANALQRKAQLRDREVQATQQKAVGRVVQELEPFIRQVYEQKKCSMLVSRDALVIANPAMDITPQVITGLNGKITQFAFDREHLDQPAAPAQTK
ncbi:OmpH family outer membrane protein [Phenylobacterium sp.]|uniref:OmpH family outer membrane protein n=1 Tax=Phenylobacterium sp. TaxID=1871053 RepID=UPI0035AF255C